MGGNEGGGAGGERWSFFGTSRPVVQKSTTDPGSETNTGKKSVSQEFQLLGLLAELSLLKKKKKK